MVSEAGSGIGACKLSLCSLHPNYSRKMGCIIVPYRPSFSEGWITMHSIADYRRDTDRTPHMYDHLSLHLRLELESEVHLLV